MTEKALETHRLRELKLIEQMQTPVRCKCGEIYDLGRVTVKALPAPAARDRSRRRPQVVEHNGGSGNLDAPSTLLAQQRRTSSN